MCTFGVSGRVKQRRPQSLRDFNDSPRRAHLRVLFQNTTKIPQENPEGGRRCGGGQSGGGCSGGVSGETRNKKKKNIKIKEKEEEKEQEREKKEVCGKNKQKKHLETSEIGSNH